MKAQVRSVCVIHVLFSQQEDVVYISLKEFSAQGILWLAATKKTKSHILLNKPWTSLPKLPSFHEGNKQQHFMYKTDIHALYLEIVSLLARRSNSWIVEAFYWSKTPFLRITFSFSIPSWKLLHGVTESSQKQEHFSSE